MTQQLVAARKEREEGVEEAEGEEWWLHSAADVFIPKCPLWSASAVRANACECKFTSECVSECVSKCMSVFRSMCVCVCIVRVFLRVCLIH